MITYKTNFTHFIQNLEKDNIQTETIFLVHTLLLAEEKGNLFQKRNPFKATIFFHLPNELFTTHWQKFQVLKQWNHSQISGEWKHVSFCCKIQIFPTFVFELWSKLISTSPQWNAREKSSSSNCNNIHSCTSISNTNSTVFFFQQQRHLFSLLCPKVCEISTKSKES